jgi:5-methylcytosine-specific restriction endonuclease McrA
LEYILSNQYPVSSKENRKTAILNGEKVYDGIPCKSCGSTKKHVSSYSCVECNIKRSIHKLYNNELMAKYRTKEKLKKYWENNKDKAKQIDDRYNSSEKGKITNTNKAATRRARTKNQLPFDADFDIIKNIYAECRKLSLETGIPHEVDHIIPIAKGGLHHQDNLQIITMNENRKKGSNIL